MWLGLGSWAEKRCSARFCAGNGDVNDGGDKDRDVTLDSYPSPLPFARAAGAETGPGTGRPAPVSQSAGVRSRPQTTPRRRSSLRVTVFGPKPKRRTEFVLLVFGSGIIVALYIIMSLGHNSKIPADLSPFLGILLGLALIAHMANRWLIPDANAVLLPVAALLNGIGYVIISEVELLLLVQR